MFKELIPSINEVIRKKKKAIIALGCSFVEGHGALDQRIYDNYPWRGQEFGNPNVLWDLTDEQKTQLITEFPDITLSPTKDLQFHIHENSNSFVNVLAKKYFDGEYAAINLGLSGCGNRATIKNLYFYPDILWDELEEIIVIFCPSGPERFDFADDAYFELNNHRNWVAMWPNENSFAGPRKPLWQGYKDGIYSAKYEIVEQISHIQELLLWCKVKNAKLIITPAFQTNYTRSQFTRALRHTVVRDLERNKTKEIFSYDKNVDQLVEMWPWDKMFYPNGAKTFVDLAMNEEFLSNAGSHYFYNYMGKGTPNKWITPCAHPSVKAHDLFAKYLYEYIKGQS